MISALHDCVAPILATRHESSPQVLLEAFERESYAIFKKVCTIHISIKPDYL